MPVSGELMVSLRRNLWLDEKFFLECKNRLPCAFKCPKGEYQVVFVLTKFPVSILCHSDFHYANAHAAIYCLHSPFSVTATEPRLIISRPPTSSHLSSPHYFSRLFCSEQNSFTVISICSSPCFKPCFFTNFDDFLILRNTSQFHLANHSVP